jgi:Rps23 Pro-64 3,4-dihydroxylase Tpa1-like proline 4-hydroxylase
MEFNYIADGIDAIVIDNFYSKEQLNVILPQCINLSSQFMDPENTSGAKLEGKIIKSNRGVFVDKLPFQESLRDKTFTDNLIITCSFYKVFRDLKNIKTLISLYNDGDFYGKHIDDSIFTMVTYVHETPKKYTGGDIILHSCYSNATATIESKNNRAVIFPSCTPHEVTLVSGSGRFCISNFIN